MRAVVGSTGGFIQATDKVQAAERAEGVSRMWFVEGQVGYAAVERLGIELAMAHTLLDRVCILQLGICIVRVHLCKRPRPPLHRSLACGRQDPVIYVGFQ